MSVAGPPAGPAMVDVEARISAIQARIDGLVGTGTGRAVPVFDLPADPEPELPAGAAEPPPASPATGEAAAGDTPAAPAAGVAAPPPVPAATAAAQDAVAAPVAATAGAAVAAPSTTDARGASLAARLPPHGRHLAGAIETAAVRAGIEPSLLAALVRHESNFDQNAVSRAGAIGLTQLMPGTAAGLRVDPHDPLQNLDGGARYLRQQLDRFGSPELALAAYNAGPNRVAQAGGVPRIAETQAYVGRVMSTWEQLR